MTSSCIVVDLKGNIFWRAIHHPHNIYHHASINFLESYLRELQGCLLGPMFFLLLMNDLHDTVTSSRVTCHAHETKVLRTVDSITDYEALQSDLSSLVDWSQSSRLLFNQSSPNVNVSLKKEVRYCVSILRTARNWKPVTRRKILVFGFLATFSLG